MKNGLHSLFLSELSDIHNAEKQLVNALPKLAKASENEELREAFESHLHETEEHVSRLDKVFELLGESPKRKQCKGMAGVIEEGKEVIEEHEDTAELNAALIAAAQKAEHYEIASYGCLCTWAKMMDHKEALKLLKETLAEEKEANDKLNRLAMSVANPQAAEAIEG